MLFPFQGKIRNSVTAVAMSNPESFYKYQQPESPRVLVSKQESRNSGKSTKPQEKQVKPGFTNYQPRFYKFLEKKTF